MRGNMGAVDCTLRPGRAGSGIGGSVWPLRGGAAPEALG
jgi:hypothetical protein